jgi:hypothetical protein
MKNRRPCAISRSSSPAIGVMLYNILSFMATRFKEVDPNKGVDDNVGAIPEMIVPRKGANDILLIDAEGIGKPQAEKPNMVDITEVKELVRKDLPNPHMVRLTGKALPGKDGLLVLARRGRTVVATLRVYVLDNRKVRLAVRPLQTAQGVSHATKLPDAAAFVAKMNKIWTPQANVLIDLVSSRPALIDDHEQIARDLGFFEADGVTPNKKKGVFQAKIRVEGGTKDDPNFLPVFFSYLAMDPDENADFTLFVVHAINAGSGHTFGATEKKTHKFALVSEDADARQWAHEVGHHLGGEDSGKGELMESGEEGEKIPVQDALKVFNRLHT